ncbi:unnamed protein product [Prorocentrum cordatum]|uniref:Uncharacterized protein n=1 Tax=Prorocentrum cordatum TaxID=2364126 RepID=A0ABN9UVT6_9DINO|nr:unnamed protein product [Polarella glacialis]
MSTRISCFVRFRANMRNAPLQVAGLALGGAMDLRKACGKRRRTAETDEQVPCSMAARTPKAVAAVALISTSFKVAGALGRIVEGLQHLMHASLDHAEAVQWVRRATVLGVLVDHVVIRPGSTDGEIGVRQMPRAEV